MHQAIKEMREKLSQYNFEYVYGTIYEDIPFQLYRLSNTYYLFGISDNDDYEYFKFKGFKDDNWKLEEVDFYDSSSAIAAKNLEVKKEDIYILAKKFSDFVKPEKTLDELLKEERSFKEINNFFKNSDIERQI